MQGRERGDPALLDAAGLAGHLVPAGSMFAFLAAHRFSAAAGRRDVGPALLVPSDSVTGSNGLDGDGYDG